VHAVALAESPEIDFVGVWARNAAAGEALAGRYGVRAFVQFRDLLGNCDAVSFAVPPAAQSELGSLAARLGKSVLLEVPIGWDLDSAEDLTKAVVASGVVSQVAFTWRYTETVRLFLEELAPLTPPQAARGRVIRARTEPPRRTSQWRRERGLLLDVGPHVVDLLDAALGSIVEVDAGEDADGWVKLKLEHHLRGSSESSLSTGTGLDHDRAEFEFFGPDGATLVDCSDAEARADYGTMFAEFAGAVRTGDAHELDVRRGLHVQRVIEAADTKLLLGG
jgi:predicted dehydrogenase